MRQLGAGTELKTSEACPSPCDCCRQMAAGDRLRVMYDSLSKDPNSLANLDQARHLLAPE